MTTQQLTVLINTLDGDSNPSMLAAVVTRIEVQSACIILDNREQYVPTEEVKSFFKQTVHRVQAAVGGTGIVDLTDLILVRQLPSIVVH
jgi:hypothetical protein